MSRFRQGWELTKRSWAVLRGNRQLLWFPIVGAIVILVVGAATIGPGIYLFDTGETALGAVLTAIGIYLATFVSVYFAVALAATADAIFAGREARFGDGIAVANQRLGAISGWAAISALVGTALSALQQSGGIGEAIAATLTSVAWGLITFLAVPVIAIEGTGPWTTLKRSASLFKERWAGQITGNVAIGGIVFLLGVLPAIALIALGVYLWISDDAGAELAGGAVLVAIGIVLLLVSILIVHAMRGVFGVALYRFASKGEVVSGFTQAELESAVRTRGSTAHSTV